MLIIDFHLDLSMNALDYNRDLTLPVATTRVQEAGMPGKGRGGSTVALPEMRAGRVALSSATVICRVQQPNSPASGVRSHAIAYAKAQGQLAYYRQLVADGEVVIVSNRADLDRHMAAWEAWEAAPAGPQPPLGFVISMEGADPIVSPEQVPQWYADGLRIVSLSHYGISATAYGTDTEGGLTPLGRPMLRALDDAGIILDLTHLADQAFYEAMDAFDGPVLASHNNCRALVPGVRQFTDDQLRRIIERNGVVGAALDAWMMYPGWVKGVTQPSVVDLNVMVDHIDHVCQLAGNADHAAIGTDLDGGYGKEQTPHDLDTIADLQKVADLLRARGYDASAVSKIMHGNWVALLRRAWPA
jgi:membrane dipeptidase